MRIYTIIPAALRIGNRITEATTNGNNTLARSK
jgi:hypothetical protein